MNWLSLVLLSLKLFVGVDRDGCTRTRPYPTRPMKPTASSTVTEFFHEGFTLDSGWTTCVLGDGMLWFSGATDRPTLHAFRF